MSEEKIIKIMKISQKTISLETAIGEEKDTALGDFITNEEIQEPLEAITLTMLKEQLINVLETLTQREEEILRLRFGFDDGRARTSKKLRDYLD